MFRRCIQYIGFRNLIFAIVALGVLLVCNNILLLWNFRAPLLPAQHAKVHGYEPEGRIHPIETLMADAERSFEALVSKQTPDLQSAAKVYRQRRGRHPPPSFDAWFAYAQQNDAIIVEELFDQIYHDLTPFWGVPAKSMRDFARGFEHRIWVRNATASMTQNHSQGTSKDRMEAWLEVVKSIEQLLPNVDMAINIMDESRVISPWEHINKYVETEGQTRKLSPYNQTITRYSNIDVSDEKLEESPGVDWIGPSEPYWNIARVGCASHAPARDKAATTNFTGPPPLPSGYPSRSYYGYVQNWTYARDPCQYRYLQEAHGTFIEPVSISTTRALVPIFGESKLTSLNNDILIPPAAYLSEKFGSGDYAATDADGGKWSDKIGGVVWRGVASGGRNKEENWTRFHRHRFVSMLNGSQVQNIEASPESAGQGRNFKLQSYARYRLAATKYMDLGTWLKRITNVGFTKLLCWPPTSEATCEYTTPYFEISKKIAMSKQYNYKFLPDIDGNSFSGRYLAFLRSTSVPIKATIYSEWHDDRLVPWLHFVPMDNSYVDVYGILDYFLGTGDEDVAVRYGAHDDAAEKIATRGQGWANKVLRKEDMHVYMLRLLLEYARLCDDDREKLGFVQDAKDGGGA